MTKKSPRYTLPIDAIISIPPSDPLAFMAARMGFKIGTHSSMRCLVENQQNWTWAFPMTFIDCEFKKYDHEKHLTAIKANSPKYATVRDLMTKEQCDRASIEYFDFDTVMSWACELEQYAENIIVIPKYNCIADIPDRFMLGYSIPTKYAGTPLPREMFCGHRIHLLGGSWKRQREHIQFFGSDVVSFDNNNLWKVSVYGNFDWRDGRKGNLKDIKCNEVSSPMYTSVAISLGHIATELHEMYSSQEQEKVFAFQFPEMEDVI
jgi:hypothetical protein